MKLKKYILSSMASAIMLFAMPSCTDYLDVSEELAGNLTREQVFNNVGYTKRWHANIFNCISEYSAMTVTLSGFQNPWAAMSGEIVSSWGQNRYEMLNGFHAGNASFHRFVPLYQYIRQAFIFLKDAKPLGAVGDQDRLTEDDIARMKAEAKFFIAYSYFSLFELYGPVPLLSDEIDPLDNNLDYDRASVDEIVNYIDQLLTEVVNSKALPETINTTNPDDGSPTYNLNEMVRPTLAAALALKAKLWVFAASPLFNGKYEEALAITNNDGKKLFPTYDAGKWTTAKTALEKFLEFAKTNRYKLYEAKDADGNLDPNASVYNVLQDYNDEIIWASANNSFSVVNDGMDRRSTPRDMPGTGWASYGCTQEAVDAFFMANGLEITDNNSGYKEDGLTSVKNPCYTKLKATDADRIDTDVFNMYANREPRFYNAVTYQGKSWHIQPNAKPTYAVDFAQKGGCDNSQADNPRIGYLLYKRTNRKMINESNSSFTIKKYGRPSVIFRLADFYLYYAEVCNEINPNDPNIIKYVDLVRARAGIPGYQELNDKGLKTGIIGNQKEQVRIIHRERQVELYTEGQRYFDIRRWMICGPGEEADQSAVHGMDMAGLAAVRTNFTKDASGNYVQQLAPIGAENSFFRRIVFEKRQWTKAMYLYPIPQAEINKSRKLVQNPLW